MNSNQDQQKELEQLMKDIGSPEARARGADILARFRSGQPSSIIAFWNNFVSSHPDEEAEFCKLFLTRYVASMNVLHFKAPWIGDVVAAASASASEQLENIYKRQRKSPLFHPQGVVDETHYQLECSDEVISLINSHAELDMAAEERVLRNEMSVWVSWKELAVRNKSDGTAAALDTEDTPEIFGVTMNISPVLMSLLSHVDSLREDQINKDEREAMFFLRHNGQPGVNERDLAAGHDFVYRRGNKGGESPDLITSCMGKVVSPSNFQSSFAATPMRRMQGADDEGYPAIARFVMFDGLSDVDPCLARGEYADCMDMASLEALFKIVTERKTLQTILVKDDFCAKYYMQKEEDKVDDEMHATFFLRATHYILAMIGAKYNGLNAWRDIVSFVLRLYNLDKNLKQVQIANLTTAKELKVFGRISELIYFGRVMFNNQFDFRLPMIDGATRKFGMDYAFMRLKPARTASEASRQEEFVFDIEDDVIEDAPDFISRMLKQPVVLELYWAGLQSTDLKLRVDMLRALSTKLNSVAHKIRENTFASRVYAIINTEGHLNEFLNPAVPAKESVWLTKVNQDTGDSWFTSSAFRKQTELFIGHVITELQKKTALDLLEKQKEDQNIGEYKTTLEDQIRKGLVSAFKRHGSWPSSVLNYHAFVGFMQFLIHGTFSEMHFKTSMLDVRLEYLQSDGKEFTFKQFQGEDGAYERSEYRGNFPQFKADSWISYNYWARDVVLQFAFFFKGFFQTTFSIEVSANRLRVKDLLLAIGQTEVYSMVNTFGHEIALKKSWLKEYPHFMEIMKPTKWTTSHWTNIPNGLVLLWGLAAWEEFTGFYFPESFHKEKVLDEQEKYTFVSSSLLANMIPHFKLETGAEDDSYSSSSLFCELLENEKLLQAIENVLKSKDFPRQIILELFKPGTRDNPEENGKVLAINCFCHVKPITVTKKRKPRGSPPNKTRARASHRARGGASTEVEQSNDPQKQKPRKKARKSQESDEGDSKEDPPKQKFLEQAKKKSEEDDERSEPAQQSRFDPSSSDSSKSEKEEESDEEETPEKSTVRRSLARIGYTSKKTRPSASNSAQAALEKTGLPVDSPIKQVEAEQVRKKSHKSSSGGEKDDPNETSLPATKKGQASPPPKQVEEEQVGEHSHQPASEMETDDPTVAPSPATKKGQASPPPITPPVALTSPPAELFKDFFGPSPNPTASGSSGLNEIAPSSFDFVDPNEDGCRKTFNEYECPFFLKEGIHGRPRDFLGDGSCTIYSLFYYLWVKKEGDIPANFFVTDMIPQCMTDSPETPIKFPVRQKVIAWMRKELMSEWKERETGKTNWKRLGDLKIVANFQTNITEKEFDEEAQGLFQAGVDYSAREVEENILEDNCIFRLFAIRFQVSVVVYFAQNKNKSWSTIIYSLDGSAGCQLGLQEQGFAMHPLQLVNYHPFNTPFTDAFNCTVASHTVIVEEPVITRLSARTQVVEIDQAMADPRKTLVVTECLSEGFSWVDIRAELEGVSSSGRLDRFNMFAKAKLDGSCYLPLAKEKGSRTIRRDVKANFRYSKPNYNNFQKCNRSYPRQLAYWMDIAMEEVTPIFYNKFLKNFRLTRYLPAGEGCLHKHLGGPRVRPLLGPLAFLGPSEAVTPIHEDGGGTVDSGHLNVQGYNQILIFPRMTGDQRKVAREIMCLDESMGWKTRDNLWPKVDMLRRLLVQRIIPVSVVLSPGELLHINKGRLHCFMKAFAQPAQSEMNPKGCNPPTACNPPTEPALSIAWDWVNIGEVKETCDEVSYTLKRSTENRTKGVASLAWPETCLIRMLLKMKLEDVADVPHKLLVHMGCILTRQITWCGYVNKGELTVMQVADEDVEDRVEPNGVRMPVPIEDSFRCAVCNFELSNVYFQCGGCRTLLNQNFLVCGFCYGAGEHKKWKCLDHSSSISYQTSVNHIVNYEPNTWHCHPPCDRLCDECKRCVRCGCLCHTRFVCRFRFLNSVDLQAKLKLLNNYMDK